MAAPHNAGLQVSCTLAALTPATRSTALYCTRSMHSRTLTVSYPRKPHAQVHLVRITSTSLHIAILAALVTRLHALVPSDISILWTEQVAHQEPYGSAERDRCRSSAHGRRVPFLEHNHVAALHLVAIAALESLWIHLMSEAVLALHWIHHGCKTALCLLHHIGAPPRQIQSATTLPLKYSLLLPPSQAHKSPVGPILPVGRPRPRQPVTSICRTSRGQFRDSHWTMVEARLRRASRPSPRRISVTGRGSTRKATLSPHFHICPHSIPSPASRTCRHYQHRRLLPRLP